MLRTLLLATTGLALLSGSALAQSSAEGTPSGEEEVVVTAQKRTQKLADVPIAISVTNAATLKTLGATRPQDLNMVTPALNFGQSLAFSTPFLRGVGNTTTLQGDEAVVATYVDGVYMNSMTTSSVPFNNIQRVEVLKGPQGTLFGRNATGGLIQIITRDPSEEFRLEMGASYGNFDTLSGNLYVNGEIAEGLTANFSMAVREQGEGYIHNRTTGNDIGEEDYQAYRAKIRFAPSSTSEFILILDHSTATNTLAAVRIARPGSIPRPAATNGALFSTEQEFTYNPLDPLLNSETFGAALKARFDLGFAELVSISAYRKSDTSILATTNMTSVDNIFGATVSFLANQNDPYFYSQEFQLVSNGAGPFEWIVGTFLQRSKGEYNPQLVYFAANGAPFSGFRSSLATDAWAVFGQGSYKFENDISLTIGLRYSDEEKTVNMQGLLANAAFAPVVDRKKSWGSVTWRIGLDYKPTTTSLLYATYSRGFKSGTFNNAQPNPVLLTAVDPEQLDAYEIGYRWASESNNFSFSANAFYYDYTDLQVTGRDPVTFSGTLQNAAGAEIYGAEFEARLNATENLTFTAGVSLLHAEYTSFPNAIVFVPNPNPLVAGNVSAVLDVSGNQVVRAPEFTVSLGFDYVASFQDGVLGVGGNVFYSAAAPMDFTGRTQQEAYTQANGVVYWEPDDASWRVSLFGRNIFDEQYINYCSPAGIGDGCAYAAPRTYGVSVDVRW